LGERAFDLQGHRGARGLWPENTLGGFERTLALGVDTFELDVAMTRDGVVVISHDPQLNPDHTRDATGRFPCPFRARHLRRGLRRARALRRGPHPAREQLRARASAATTARRGADPAPRRPVRAGRQHGWASGAHLNIEVKVFPLQPELTAAPEPFTRALLAVIDAAGMAARSTIQCFDWRVLNLVHRLAPGVATGALTDQQGDDDTLCLGAAAPSPWLGGLDARQFGGSVPRLAKASGAGTWSPDYLDLSAAQVAEAHVLGLLVVPWTVNNPADMRRIVAMNVDGMISDRPDLLQALLGDQ
jgi:glycerophosphoryl diester phosphodiesterase